MLKYYYFEASRHIHLLYVVWSKYAQLWLKDLILEHLKQMNANLK